MPRARSTSTWRPVSALMMTVLALAGCERAGDGDRTVPVAEVAAATEADQWPNPADDACMAFGTAFERAAQEANVASMNALIDWDVILEKVVGDTQGMDEFVAGFVKGAKIGIAGADGLAGELAKMVKQGGSLKFLHVRDRDGRKSILFRQLSEDVALDYYEFLVAVNPEGDVRAVDIYDHVSAEYMSTTIRRTYIPLMASKSRGLVARATGQESEFVKHFAQIGEMKEKTRAGQFAEALQIYDSLPESLQGAKNVLVMRLQAAMRLSDDQYMRALDVFLRHFPDDPCADLASIDYFALRDQHDKALAGIDRMSQAIGGDPYLLVLKGNTYVAQGDLAKAREMFKTAMDAEPTLMEAYQGFVDISVAEKNFGDTLRWLNAMKNRFPMESVDLATIPEYAEFVKSPEYQTWTTTREAEANK